MRVNAPKAGLCSYVTRWDCFGKHFILASSIAQRKEETMPYYMYVALQEDDKIAVFTIDPQTGKLTP